MANPSLNWTHANEIVAQTSWSRVRVWVDATAAQEGEATWPSYPNLTEVEICDQIIESIGQNLFTSGRHEGEFGACRTEGEELATRARSKFAFMPIISDNNVWSG